MYIDGLLLADFVTFLSFFFPPYFFLPHTNVHLNYKFTTHNNDTRNELLFHVQTTFSRDSYARFGIHLIDEQSESILTFILRQSIVKCPYISTYTHLCMSMFFFKSLIESTNRIYLWIEKCSIILCCVSIQPPRTRNALVSAFT